MLSASATPAELRVARTRDATVVVEIDRPRARNALSSGVISALETTLSEAERDSSVRAVVLSGTAPGFCAGSDLKELAEMAVDEMVQHESRTGHFVRSLQHFSKPLIAAVEGFALGGGFLLAAGCDLVVTAENARWHLPEVALGWVPPWGLQALLARTTPVTARRLAWGAQPFTGEELAAMGVLDVAVASGTAREHAAQLAAQLAAMPPHAVASTKRALADAVTGDADRLDQLAGLMFASDCATPEAEKSLSAFTRKASKESA